VLLEYIIKRRLENTLKACHVRRPRTFVNQVNAKQINGLIWDNHHITLRELAETVGISVDSFETIIRDKLNFRKVGAWWLSKLLSDEQMERQVKIATQLLDHSERERK
jgi:uncharacterized protein YjgD (DUF1641 family)